MFAWIKEVTTQLFVSWLETDICRCCSVKQTFVDVL